MMHRAFGKVLFLLIGSWSCVATGADWPTWGGPLGRNAADRIALPQDFDRKTGENIRWITPLGEVAFGVPTIANGRVFVGTNMAAVRDDGRYRGLTGGVLLCLDEGTGERLWSMVCPERTTGFPPQTFMEEQRWGICSSPAVDGDRVYVITNGNDLLCVDVHGQANGNDGPFQTEAKYMAGEGRAPVELRTDDGDILWRYDIPRELSVAPHDVGATSPLVVGDWVYTSTSNGIGRYRARGPVDAVRPAAPAFIAVNKHTGTLGAVDDTTISRDLFHAQWASPSHAVVAGRSVVFLGGSDGYCYAFPALTQGHGGAEAQRLETSWRVDCNPANYRVDGDGVPISYHLGDHRAYQRRKELNDIVAGYRERGETALRTDYVASLDSYNASEGDYVGPSEVLSTPVWYRDRLYVTIGRDPLHGLGRGALTCIDARQDVSSEARVLWRYEDMGRTMSTVAVADGLVYAVDLAGTVYCLDAGMGVLYWRHETGHETWGNPLVADGKVYVNTTRSFWTFAAGRKKTVLFEGRGGSETAPVVANGVVYAVIRGQLYAIGEKDLKD